MIRYLLQYDSVYRRFEMEVKEEKDGISVEGKKIFTSQSPEPEGIPWENYDVEIVIDATGAFTTKADLVRHLRGKVKKVILTTPAKDKETLFVVLGVNDQTFDFKNNSIISMASCTTNCAAPMFKILDDYFGVKHGFLTTAHAVTASQSMLDDANKKADRSRAAMINIIPSTTGAAEGVSRVIPSLKRKVDGISFRVPVPTGSITDIVAVVNKKTSSDEVNQLFLEASKSSLKGIIGYAEDILVSSDIIGSSYSCLFDPHYTKVIDGNLIKILGWYDNEWGYSTRLVDLVEKLTAYL